MILFIYSVHISAKSIFNGTEIESIFTLLRILIGTTIANALKPSASRGLEDK